LNIDGSVMVRKDLAGPQPGYLTLTRTADPHQVTIHFVVMLAKLMLAKVMLKNAGKIMFRIAIGCLPKGLPGELTHSQSQGHNSKGHGRKGRVVECWKNCGQNR
jgi:hypothetical protein